MFKFRPYQEEIITDGVKKLSRLRIIMLAMEVRTGKTFTSLGIADRMNSKSVFVYHKEKDYS